MTQADIELDILGQQPRVNRLYTQLTFFLEVLGDYLTLSPSNIAENLTQGLKRLSASFPWTAGRVTYQDGVFKIRFSQEPEPPKIRDLRNHAPPFPSLQTLRDADFPFSMLDEAVVAARNTLAVPDATVTEMPVLLIQANLIKGGLLLTVNAQHGAMDMAGQCFVISLFAKACRGEEFTPEELIVGNMDRKRALSEFIRLNMAQPLTDFAHFSTAVDPLTQRTPQAAPTSLGLCWSYFVFSPASLTELKSSASRNIPASTFISTDDALSALTWQSITRARQPRLSNDTSFSLPSNTTLSRNVDMRHLAGLPPTYPGFITDSTTHTASVDTLAKQTVGEIAYQLRSALNPQSLIANFHTQLTAIRGKYGENNGFENDKENRQIPQPTSFATSSNPALDVRLSSWAKEKCYDFDFGPGLGKPMAVRRPKFMEGAREGLVYFLPKTRDGEIAVGVCLREDDMERLKGQKDEWMRYGHWVG